MDKHENGSENPRETVINNFRIKKITYSCGAPDCPDHEATVEEFLEYVAFLVVLMGVLPSNQEMLVMSMMAEQARSGNMGSFLND